MIKQASRFIMIQRQKHAQRPLARQRPTNVLRDDRGLTVVEMLVATMIVAIGVVGASSVFVLSARSTAAAGTRSEAAAVLAADLESIRALPFDAVGIDPTSVGYVASVDGRPTVSGGADLVEPLEVVEVGDQEFRVARAVTWVTIGAEPEGYKLVRVTVSWTDSAGDHDIAAQTGIFGDSDG